MYILRYRHTVLVRQELTVCVYFTYLISWLSSGLLSLYGTGFLHPLSITGLFLLSTTIRHTVYENHRWGIGELGRDSSGQWHHLPKTVWPSKGRTQGRRWVNRRTPKRDVTLSNAVVSLSTVSYSLNWWSLSQLGVSLFSHLTIHFRIGRVTGHPVKTPYKLYERILQRSR